MDVVYASETRQVSLPDGGLGTIVKGSHWAATDPIVKAHPDVFTPDPRYGMAYSVEPPGWESPVEQTTAGPGEKRAAVGHPVNPVDASFDEAEDLRAELLRLGVPVDSKWNLKRLREEMQKLAQ